MTWYNSNEHKPEQEKEGDYFLIKLHSINDITRLAIVKKSRDISYLRDHHDKLVLFYIKTKGWSGLPSRMACNWKCLDKNEMMAYL